MRFLLQRQTVVSQWFNMDRLVVEGTAVRALALHVTSPGHECVSNGFNRETKTLRVLSTRSTKGKSCCLRSTRSDGGC